LIRVPFARFEGFSREAIMAFLKRTAETGLALVLVAGLLIAVHQLLRASQKSGAEVAPHATIAPVRATDEVTSRRVVPVTLVSDAVPTRPVPAAADKASTGGVPVDDELPQSSVEEHEILHKILKELPANDQRESLRVRREKLHQIRRAALAYPPTTRQPPLVSTKDGRSNGDLPHDLSNGEHAPASEGTGSEVMIGEALAAIEQARQVILGNLANAETPGYKRRIVSFLTNHDGPTTADHDQSRQGGQAGSRGGPGVGLVPNLVDNSQGKLRRTGRRLDLAIEGPGFFQIESKTGSKGQYRYTRYGRFDINAHGNLVLRGMKHEWILGPSVQVPLGATDIDVGIDGIIQITEGNGGGNRNQIGQLQLASFLPDGALALDDDVALVSVALLGAKYAPGAGNPGLEARGLLKQGYYEESNVDPLQELAELQKLQRQAQFLEEALRLIRGANSGQN
jgi:flagellar basal-body rod protein FlgG